MKERTRLGIFSGGFGNILEEQWQVDVQLKAKKKKKKIKYFTKYLDFELIRTKISFKFFFNKLNSEQILIDREKRNHAIHEKIDWIHNRWIQF